MLRAEQQLSPTVSLPFLSENHNGSHTVRSQAGFLVRKRGIAYKQMVVELLAEGVALIEVCESVVRRSVLQNQNFILLQMWNHGLERARSIAA